MKTIWILDAVSKVSLIRADLEWPPLGVVLFSHHEIAACNLTYDREMGNCKKRIIVDIAKSAASALNIFFSQVPNFAIQMLRLFQPERG